MDPPVPRHSPPSPGPPRPRRGPDLTWSELADGLWLAGHEASASASSAAVDPKPVRAPPVTPSEPASASPDPEDVAAPAPDHRSDAAGPDGTPPGFDLLLEVGGPSLGEVAGWPAVPALRNPTVIVRALRPLKRMVPSRRNWVPDEEATAERSADDPLWLPVFRPAAEHRWDLVLVVDDGPSMVVWRRTVKQFTQTLQRSGVFQNVHTRLLTTATTDPDALYIRGLDRASLAAAPFELLEHTGRRIILVLTDGAAPAWSSRAALTVLRRWGRVMPTAVIHLLPQQFWHRTGVAPRRVRLRAPAPGAANTRLVCVPRDIALDEPEWVHPTDPRRCPIPVLELEERWLKAWVRLLVGGPSSEIDLTAITAPAQPVDAPPGLADAPASRSPDGARAQVSQFRATATPTAFALATHLAAAPLNLPVVHMIQAVLLPRSEPRHLAEIYASGLLRPTSAAERLDVPDKVTLDFADGVREELLSIGRRGDTMRVLRAVDEFLGPIVEAVSGLGDAVERPEEAKDRFVTAETKPFIAVEQAALQALSGRHLARSRRLREALNQATDAEAERSSDSHPPPNVTEEPMSTSSAQGERSARLPSMPPATDGCEVEPSALAGLTPEPEPTRPIRRRTAITQPTVWGNIPPRNPNFTGRVQLLTSLHDRLIAGTTAVLPEALHGMGGVGKSQLAIEYVYRHQDEYDLIWWIPAERTAQIRQALSELAQRLDLEIGTEANATVPAVLEALRIGRPYGNWLLVFDNAESPEAVRQFFPTGGPGCILVTSRDPRWASLAWTLEVDVFTRAESIDLLRRRNEDLTVADADRLAAALGDLPLAIEQAATWRRETGMPADEYLRLLNQKHPELLDDAPPLGYPTTVAAAWNVSLDALRERNLGALRLLQLCAFLAPEPVSRSLFSGARATEITPELDEALRDPIKFGRAVREINRYGLARLDHRTNSIQMHRLVQRVLIGQMDDDEQEMMSHGAHLLLAASDPNQPDDVAHWTRYGELHSHLISSGAIECDDGWVRRLILNEAKYLWRLGDPEGSREIAQRAYEVWRSKLGDDDPETLEVGHWLGFMLFTGARYGEAEELTARLLADSRRVLGEEHETTLTAMQQVAAIRRAVGDFDTALQISDNVYSRTVRLFGADDPLTLRAAHNLAVSLRLVGEFGRAKALDQDTVQRFVLAFGEDHPDTMITQLGLILDQRELGDYADARTALEDLVARHRMLFGDMNFFTLRAVRTLSVTLRKAGDHAGALACSEDARARFTTLYGPDHAETMAAELDLSTDRRQNGDLRSARELGRAALDRYRRALGDDHPHTIGAAVNLATTQRLLGAVEQAYATDTDALARLRASLGEGHLMTLSCAINVASDMHERGEYQEAHDLDADTLTRLRDSLDEDHPVALACAANLAVDLRALGRIDEAQTRHTETMARFIEVLGREHPASREAAEWTRANCDMYPMPL
ncbi:FxSxx-COOH system tetratricopeptide repeat protein [Phytohabitans rumicis]|uniref:Cytochrome c n=1 Tax=Phytohabitans rumicis TaxID=1076125 RepID=A0A6V8L615_9ACTN|nr:FxSxx-COOH system tetratricopeptide repeat protein [Phytohabitans rumicis]GFJ89477.1 cytochrome c [Phytohabitans rumicis]